MKSFLIFVIAFFWSNSLYAQSDVFEPDNTASTGTNLTVNGSAQQHTIYPAGDVDWYNFTAIIRNTYTISTSGNTDTYMYLFSRDTTTQIAYDDDSGEGLNASITWTCDISGTYYVKVRQFSSSATGSYSIGITTPQRDIDSFSVASFTQEPQGIEYVNGYLYVAQGENPYRRIHKFDISGNFIQTIATSNGCPRELAWDGNYFWHPNACTSTIYKINLSGNTISSYTMPYHGPCAIAWDGNYFWVTFNSQGNKIFKMNTSGNLTGDYIVAPTSSYPTGLVYVNGYLWLSGSQEKKIYKIDMQGNVLQSIDSRGTNPSGLAYDGTYLWNADIGTDTVYRINIESDTTTSITLNEPSNNITVIKPQAVLISWNSTYNASGTPVVWLGYDKNTDPTTYEGQIVSGVGMNSSYYWDTSNVQAGTYYVFGFITDGSLFDYDYASGTVTIQENQIPILPLDGSRQDVTISNAGGYKWYSLNVSSASTITIQTHGSYDTFLHLYQSDRTTQIEEDDDDGDGNNALITRRLDTGTYYVKARFYSPNRTGSFQISALQENIESDPYEPNNTRETAYSITLDSNGKWTSSNAEISSASDQDWFGFNAVRGKAYVFVCYVTSTLDAEVDLFDSSGKKLMEIDSYPEGSTEFTFYVAKESQRLYVGIGYFAGIPKIAAIKSPNGSYVLAISEEVVEIPVLSKPVIIPNPANPTASIMFSVSAPGILRIKVYNILGQQMLDLDFGYLNPGTHKYEIPVKNLSAGIYVVVLENKGKKQIAKFCVIR